jgi:hypothetical protein
MRSLAVIGVTMIAMVAASASVAGSAPDARGRALVLVQGVPQVAFVDLNGAGPTAGDVLVFRSELFDETGAELVGDLNITCTQAIGLENICRGIFSITGRGQLAVDALPTFPLPTVGIVNGGNGEFSRSRGEVEIEPQADGTTLLTFHLFS